MRVRTALSGGPRRRLPGAAWLVLLAVLGVAWLAWPREVDRPAGEAPPVPEAARAAPRAPRLVGRAPDAAGAPDAAAEGAGAGAAEKAPAAAAPEGPQAGWPGYGVVPLAPRSIRDEVAAGAPVPLELERSYLVGERAPDGGFDERSRRGLDWVGVAALRREAPTPEPVPDETQEPVTTAVTGRVLDEAGGPLAGAEVVLYSTFYLRRSWYDHRVRQIGRVLTDADGAFDLRPVDLDTVHFGADGEVLVTVRHPRRADLVVQPLAGIVPGRVSDVGALVLPARGVRLRGVVRDLAGQPVAGAVVRASGRMNPVEYDKTERMVVLADCPRAITDAEGRYELVDFAAGRHEISIHVHIDCVLHVSADWAGEAEWSPRVRAGHGVRGRVVDAAGQPVEAAVVAGGGNWTPTSADGTFWLDNVDPGPLLLEVAHHAWFTTWATDVPTDAAHEVELRLERPLPRVRLSVAAADGAPAPLVAIEWTWAAGRGPGRFAPDSPFWNDPRGVYALIVPEHAVGARLRDGTGAQARLAAEDLEDGAEPHAVLALPAPPR